MSENLLAPIIVVFVGAIIALLSLFMIGIDSLAGQAGIIIDMGVVVWGFFRLA